MSTLYYTPATAAGWLTVARRGLAVMVAPSTIAVTDLWAALEGGFEATITLLTRDGFATMPSFALVETVPGADAVLRVIVRGTMTARVTTSAGERILDGTGVSTWTETTFSGAEGWAIDADATVAEPSFPLVSGAVSAARIASSGQAVEAVGGDARSSTGAGGQDGAQDGAQDTATTPTAAAATSDVPQPAPESDATASEATLVGVPTAEEASEGSTESEDAAESDDSAESQEGDDYDFLFGETRHIDISEARAEARLAERAEGDGEGDEALTPVGDHDGMTLVSQDIRALRARRREQAASGPTAEALVGSEPRFVLDLSTGGSEELSQPLIFGRAPTASKVSGESLPRLVTIPGDKDISRNHVQVTLEGGTVVVTDLHSRNGTQVVLPGRSPQQLRPGEPTSVIDGTVVDLGGVTLTVREER